MSLQGFRRKHALSVITINLRTLLIINKIDSPESSKIKSITFCIVL